MTQEKQREIEEKLTALHDKLVPSMGKAETIQGEMVRAINRIIYRHYNDGDVFYTGYGEETCFSSVEFQKLSTCPISNELRVILDEDNFRNKPDYLYEEAIYKAGEIIADYVISCDGNYSINNNLDSRY